MVDRVGRESLSPPTLQRNERSAGTEILLYAIVAIIGEQSDICVLILKLHQSLPISAGDRAGVKWCQGIGESLLNPIRRRIETERA